MTTKKILFYGITFLLAICSTAQGHEKKWPERRLRQTWPLAQSFTSKQVSLTPSQILELKTEGIQIGSKERSPIFYFAQAKDSSSDKPQTLGVILFVDASGANGPMEISVGLGTDGQVKNIDIWEHSENSLITKQDFLKQFIGKNARESFVINKDYKPIPEAQKASEAVADATKKALKISAIIFKKK